MFETMMLVLGEDPISARSACYKIFGEKFPNVHRTLGNLYKAKFSESISLAKKLSKKERENRRNQLQEEGLHLRRPGNPEWKPHLTPDEEKLIVCFLQTCGYMHMPFNRDGFKVLDLVGLLVICVFINYH